jgi:hypothetical protein
MDEIAIRILSWFFIDVLMHIICFGLGWAILKTLTFGKYPTKQTDENHVMITGFITIVLFIIGITVYAYNYSSSNH